MLRLLPKSWSPYFYIESGCGATSFAEASEGDPGAKVGVLGSIVAAEAKGLFLPDETVEAKAGRFWRWFAGSRFDPYSLASGAF